MSIQTDLKRFFQRTPFLAGKAMRDDVQGTMDLSLEWPLSPRLKKFDYTAAAGNNLTTLASPPPGTHMIVVYGLFFTSAPAPGQRSDMFMQQHNVPSATQAVQLSVVELAGGRRRIPLVNAFSVDTDGLALQGAGAVYVPRPMELIHAYVAAAGGETVVLRTMDYTFPETQPLSTLIEF